MRRVWSPAVALILSVAADGARAQACADHAAVVRALTDRYAETRVAVGLTMDGMMMEVWGNPDTGTWTITVTRPDGTTCLLGSGVAFETLAEVIGPNGEPL